MLHARKDYQRIQDPSGIIPNDEPVFLLRGQDACAPMTLLSWVTFAKLAGVDVEMIKAVEGQALLMNEWQLNHKKKNPDMPSNLTENEYAPAPTSIKTLHNTTASQAKDNVKDIIFWGNGDLFKLISKASSENEGWMKSTKAMQIEGVGCVVQVTTQQKGLDGTYAVAEAVTFVPGVVIIEYADSEGKITSRELSGTNYGHNTTNLSIA